MPFDEFTPNARPRFNAVGLAVGVAAIVLAVVAIVLPIMAVFGALDWAATLFPPGVE